MAIDTLDLAIVGKRVAKLDSYDKATGQAQFVDDLVLPGLLWGKALRSPHPHARLLRIDTSRAERLPGVKAVVTAADTPKKRYAVLPDQELQDRPVFTWDKVRYIGDEVAAVAAVDRDTAEEAIELITVDYEPLPAVFDTPEAMKPDAPLIHEEYGSNVVARYHWHFGNVEEGFAQADVVFEDEVSTSRQAHCGIEPNGCIARWETNGTLTMWSSTVSPFFLRKDLAKVLDVSEGRIRIMEVTVGGSYGAKCEMMNHEAICAFLARKAGRPVKVVLNREETFIATRTRHPIRLRLQTGVKRDGTIVARKARSILDNGAYNSCGPDVTLGSGYVFASLYQVKNVEFDGICVYTNNCYGGAFRGYGSPQVSFMIETQVDRICEQLGMDPAEFRLRNANRPNTVTACGWKVNSCGLPECIEKVAAASGWPEKRGRKLGDERFKRGIGMASLIHVSSARAYFDGDFSAASIRMHEDGTVTVLTGTCESGQGSRTILAQIVAEELGIRMEDVRVIMMDTEITPMCMGSWGTRVTFVAGNACKLAAAKVKQQVLTIAGEMLEANPTDLETRDRIVFVKGSPDRHVTMAQIAYASMYRPAKLPYPGIEGAMGGQQIMAMAHYDCPSEFRDKQTGYGNICAAYIFGTQVAEVEVDTLTGQVRVLKWTAAHDVGKAVNPMTCEAQVEGALSQGTGYGLFEDLVYKRGRAMNANFINYKLTTPLEIRGSDIYLVETIDEIGPFGAKGVGEPGLVPSAPAIANAIYDAVGVRITDLPITPEKVLRALNATKGRGFL